ncbi:MAG: YdcF family protein [Blautia sp.]|nr:YdcF family protein [Blautia sp.]
MKYIANKKRLRVFILLIIFVNLATLGYFALHRRDYTYYWNFGNLETESVEVEVEDESVVEVTDTTREDAFLRIDFHSKKKGITQVTLRTMTEEGEKEMWFSLRVNSFLSVFRGGRFDYSSWNVILLCRTASLILVSIFFFLEYLDRIKKDLYSYKTLQTGGIAIFGTGLSILFVLQSVLFLIILDSRNYTADGVYEIVRHIFFFFVMCAVPFVIVFSIALSISNLRLITKEGLRKVNLLGIAVSILLLTGIIVCIVVPFLCNIHTQWLYDIFMSVQSAVSAAFCFMLSFLLSTMICGLIAAKRVPSFDKDYIIILGCGVRKDGTLYPLLQGRVDRALWFWQKQCETTGKRAVLIPSGGKGDDENISEGEAMKRYLLEKGVPEECILPETKSVSTLQNMQFSKEIIEQGNPEAKVIFSTTNYHVFRSGILAGKAGLKVEGIGSRTRWYFWPNAFMREFAGLLYSARRFELLFFGGLALAAAILRLIM